MEKSKSRLFLIEMIVIILFFSIAAAVCINMFTQAKIVSGKSTELTMALLSAQQAAETFKSSGGDKEATGQRLGAQIEGENLIVTYNSDWEQTDTQPAYTMRIACSQDGGLKTADILIQGGQEEIYRVQTAVYGDEV